MTRKPRLHYIGALYHVMVRGNSGQNIFMGHEKLPWLTTEWVLSQFAQRLKTARTRYDEFVKYGKDEGHRQEFHSGTSEGRILGNDTFVERVYTKSDQTEKKAVTLDAIIDSAGNLYGLTEKEIAAGGKQRCPSEARAMIAYLVREIGGMSLTDLGRRIKRDLSSLSAAAERLLTRSKVDSDLEKRKQLLERALF